MVSMVIFKMSVGASKRVIALIGGLAFLLNVKAAHYFGIIV